ncbi:NRDE family protein [Halomarina halobia]|uniref:NRDE family protein n=1 Tax=Halomarina halobia TaxID=3033386 RepID=A0ABD6A7R2_9EURY|nr:NRDE family protein [Halomarina sp. PSR21]
MCTLTVAWQVFESHPVVVAANRDERLDRPSSSPREFADGDRRIVAPTDEEAGGTWIGYNDAGVVVAVTNLWVRGLTGERSRGLLVRDALRRGSAAAALALVEDELATRDYEGFYLLLADADDAALVANDGDPTATRFDPGVHVVMNVGYDTTYFVPEFRPDLGRQQAENGERLLRSLAPRDGETALDWRDRAATYLGDHEHGVCIHADGFGTKSSSLIAVDSEGRGSYLFADGPPCVTEYGPVDSQI